MSTALLLARCETIAGNVDERRCREERETFTTRRCCKAKLIRSKFTKPESRELTTTIKRRRRSLNNKTHMKQLSLAVIILTTLFPCCIEQQDKNTSTEEKITDTVDSAQLLSINIKKYRPSFDLKVDSTKINPSIYNKVIFVDTSNCNSFRYNREFLGKVDNLMAVAKNVDSTGILFLQSGNLKLWICSLPKINKANDTLFITGFVYDLLGEEKTWGYPTILTKVVLK